MNLLLHPAPRRIDEIPGRPPHADAVMLTSRDEELPPQGYRLEYGETVRIAHADAAGLRYALQTLAQLRATSPAPDRALRIVDWPDFARRGFQLDISRDRVPTRAGLRRLVDVLELARFNQLELYMENTFAYRDHAEVWQDASPMTPEDLHWLDDLCVARGIELVPNQNTFGHWERWLSHDEHRHRAEHPEPQTFAGTVRPPSTLAPTDDNARFVTGLLDELTPHFRSCRLNIGADETWELGTGTSRAQVAEDGLGTVFLDYVEKVARPWTERGYTVEFWADILGSHPELMDRIPAGTAPVVWLYDSPNHIATVLGRMSPAEQEFNRAHGIDAEQLRSFSSRARALIDAGVPFWVAPGTGTWLSFVGRLGNAIGNMTDAAETGIAHGSGGFLLTCWGDEGHVDPPTISYAPIVFGGGVSWALEANRDAEHRLAEILDRHVFDDAAGALGRILVDVGRVADNLDAKIGNASPLFRIIQRAGAMEPHHVPSAESLASAHDVLSSALSRLDDAHPAAADGATVIAEIRQAVRWALFGVELFQTDLVAVVDGSTEMSTETARGLLERLDRLLTDQRRTWLLAARPGGLDTSIARFAPLRRVLARLADGASAAD